VERTVCTAHLPHRTFVALLAGSVASVTWWTSCTRWCTRGRISVLPGLCHQARRGGLVVPGQLQAPDFSHGVDDYERGEVTMFVPISGTLQTVGRVSPLVVPAAEVAVTVHNGSLANLKDTYGTLGVYVSTHALGVVGPVREYYLVDARATNDAAQWRTQLAWPTFQTAKPRSKPEG
jgi:effector-binding domain-containing protein